MNKTIAVLTSGGDAPGMNTAIYELTKYAYKNKINVYGVYKGYYGLYNNLIYRLSANSIKMFEHKGGTLLKSSRFIKFQEEQIRQQCINNLKKKNIDTLIVIGGDGSYMGAKKLSKMNFRCICLPGTIDNNINGTDYTIGFFTALNTICKSIEQIKDTAFSHQRIFIIEIMGNTCSNLTIEAGIAAGCDIIITHDTKFDFELLKKKILSKINIQKEDLIIAITENICDTQQLAKKLQKDLKKEVRNVILGHVQRGGSPVALDLLLARRMSHAAIDFYINYNFSTKIGIKNNKIINY